MNMAKKIVKEKDGKREAIAKELRLLIPKLDSEGLAFLVEQARVHLYNMQVDELNNAARAADSAGARAKSIGGKAGKAKKGSAKSAGDIFRIAGSESGSSYYLYFGNDNVMFNRSEMTHLVKIVNGEGTNLEIRERLYNWLNRERRDLFALVSITDKFDERLKTLASLIKKTFKIRG